MADDSDSWSMVDAEDEASRDRVASGTGQAESTLAQAQDTDLSASTGNDSPPTTAVLEAVADTSPKQSWSLASGLSPTAAAPESASSTSLSHNAPAEASDSAVASQPSTHSVQQSDDQNITEQLPLPSLSGSDLSSTLIGTDALVSPGPLPHLHTDLGEDDSFDNNDSMSEQSSGTAVMVGHPCSDEEDTAERRWRLAEQRGNDIRRASEPPCPKAMGTEGYLKVIVAGESGLGKTTFIENLRSAFQPDSPSSTRSPLGLGTAADTYATFEHSPQQLCTEVTLESGSSKFHYFLQDTPGQVYGQTKVRIADFITAQNERYLAWEQSPRRSVPMSAGDDHRVDACLFFLNPNHLKDAEVADMVQLSELVPVVPMIAKADIFTPSELSAFRLHVRQRLAEEEERLGRAVMWRAAESEEEDEDQGCRQPPFAVIASSHSDLAVGRFWPVRSYPWGKCEAFSSTNSDLASLKRLLFEEGFAALKQATEARYYRFRASRLSHDANRPGAVLGQQQVGQRAMAAESGGEEESQWGGAADSDASSEASDMPEIMAGDPAEAAAADLYGESGQRQGGRRSWWMLGFLLAGVMCTVGCMLGNNIQQLKADNRGLRKELAIKEQVVSNLAYTLKTVNRHQHNQFQALEHQWRSGQSGMHRSTPVKVWTFDGSRW